VPDWLAGALIAFAIATISTPAGISGATARFHPLRTSVEELRGRVIDSNPHRTCRSQAMSSTHWPIHGSPSAEHPARRGNLGRKLLLPPDPLTGNP
jgi:hypothetical protein